MTNTLEGSLLGFNEKKPKKEVFKRHFCGCGRYLDIKSSVKKEIVRRELKVTCGVCGNSYF